MDNAHTLVRHRDVQAWVAKRRGLPAIRRLTGPTGDIRARLAIHFNGPSAPPAAPSLDDGIMPVSWNAWLAEFDRQGLALKVTPQEQFEFVPRAVVN